MATIALKIHIPDAYQELLIAELSDLDFDAFEQEDDFLIAYIPSQRWNDVARERIEAWLVAHNFDVPLSEESLADRNWNQQWEETVQPVVVEPFLIKPTWGDAPAAREDLILLEVDPKMSFGTGYHESTRLLLRWLPEYVAPGAHVLDAGTGTGILAVAAAKLGAGRVVAFDIDPWSHENAVENFYINNVADCAVLVKGPIEEVGESDFHLILANINLHVVIGLLPAFSTRLLEGGRLLVSGILRRDRDRLLDSAGESGFRLMDERDENEWLAAALALNVQEQSV